MARPQCDAPLVLPLVLLFIVAHLSQNRLLAPWKGFFTTFVIPRVNFDEDKEEHG